MGIVVGMGWKHGCGSVPLRGWGIRFPGIDNADAISVVVVLVVVVVVGDVFDDVDGNVDDGVVRQ